MRKKVTLLFVTMLFLVVACAGGQSAADPDAAVEDTSAGENQFYRMSTLAPGSSPNLVMTTFANIVNESVPEIEIQVNATGAATMHAIEAAREEVDLFMLGSLIAVFMSQGSAMYADIPEAPELYQNLRAVLGFPIGHYHIIVNADSGIESLEDLAGNRVFLGPPGSGAKNVASSMVTAVTGLEPDTDFEVVDLSFSAAAQAFQDQQIDVWFTSTLIPSPQVQQVALIREIRLLGIPEELLDSSDLQPLVNVPGRSIDQIAPGAYGDNQVNTEPVYTLNNAGGIGTHMNLDVEVVYAMTKAFWEGAAEMQEDAPWMAQVSLESTLDNVITPLHPGALRYYEEAGLDIPPELIPPEYEEE